VSVTSPGEFGWKGKDYIKFQQWFWDIDGRGIGVPIVYQKLLALLDLSILPLNFVINDSLFTYNSSLSVLPNLYTPNPFCFSRFIN
jgi:hypothetical protein